MNKDLTYGSDPLMLQVPCNAHHSQRTSTAIIHTHSYESLLTRLFMLFFWQCLGWEEFSPRSIKWPRLCPSSKGCRRVAQRVVGCRISEITDGKWTPGFIHNVRERTRTEIHLLSQFTVLLDTLYDVTGSSSQFSRENPQTARESGRPTRDPCETYRAHYTVTWFFNVELSYKDATASLQEG